MRYFVICDEEDTLTGLRLAGIEGILAKSKSELDEGIKSAVDDNEIAVLLLSEKCAALNPALISEIKLSSKRPLLAIIPGTEGSSRGDDSITGLIRDAIGIKI